jgi:hypothetical protein
LAQLSHNSKQGRFQVITQIVLLSLALGGTVGWLIGNFQEWDYSRPRLRQLENELFATYAELDEMRDIIYTNFGAEIRQLHPSAKRQGSN